MPLALSVPSPRTLALALGVLVATLAPAAEAQRGARRRARAPAPAPQGSLARSRAAERFRALERLLDHPSMRASKRTSWSRSQRRDLIHTVALQRIDEGRVIRSDPASRQRIETLWRRISATSKLERVPRRGKFWLEERPDGANAEAFPNGSVAFGVEFFDVAHAIARAHTSTKDGRTLLRRLARVARGAAVNRYDRRFAGERMPGDASYDRVVDGVLGAVLAHELAHIHFDHGGVDLAKPKSERVSGLDALGRKYLSPGSEKPAELREQRAALNSQYNEFQADYGGLDFALRAGLDADAILGELLVGAMKEGLPKSRSAGRAHPVGLDRFEGTRERMQGAGIQTRFDGISRDEIIRAYEDSAAD